ncbi:MAG TPA: 6,7-dimethyl-8-ribityllumazine synthase [Nitrospiria bacterium]|jgi:6,7-dimethyl-8-ribityllumazine synthase|nr:6,7-dimethyl-8-ribityllumazine synthase [Nitrospiria bacterium]
MVKVHGGRLRGGRHRFGIVISKFNHEVTSKLLEGALTSLRKHGVKEEDIEIAEVPGAFEIPLTAKRLAQSHAFHAVICLGAVIRGETAHFEYISQAVSQGLQRVMLETGIPISFGVLTTETEKQALQRADPKRFDRGGDAAKTALEMVELLQELK